MTAAQDLAANPLAFMKKNIVLAEIEGDNTARTKNGVVTLRLYARPANKIKAHMRDWRHTKLNVYYLSFDPVPAFFSDAIIDPNTIDAYFCPYKSQETHGTTISSLADLMFTTQMDGCSLGIGSATPGGDRLIFHANSGGTSNVAVNNQDQSLRREFAADNTMIQRIWAPNDYRVSSKGTYYKSTTFGVRNAATNVWSFYSQRYTIEAMSPCITLGMKGVFDVL